MSKHTKYIIAALAVVVVVSNIMFSSKARISKSAIERSLSSDFYQSLPRDLRNLRVEFDQASQEYAEAMKPFDVRLDQLADDVLSAEESEKLLAEVEQAAGKKERAMEELRERFNARFAEVVKAHQARK